MALQVNPQDKAREREVRLIRSTWVNGKVGDIGSTHKLSHSVATELVSSGKAEFVAGGGLTADEAGRVPGQVDVTSVAALPGTEPLGITNRPGERVFVAPANAAAQGDASAAIAEHKEAEKPLEELAKKARDVSRRPSVDASAAAPRNPTVPGNTPSTPKP